MLLIVGFQIHIERLEDIQAIAALGDPDLGYHAVTIVQLLIVVM